tara:strand:- start:127 stop:300 length:174 start_codon:yes stop_codon:yes gene_type:complete
MKKLRIGDNVSFRFAGSNLTGTIVAFYNKGSEKRVMITGEDKLNYPLNINEVCLTKK